MLSTFLACVWCQHPLFFPYLSLLLKIDFPSHSISKQYKWTPVYRSSTPSSFSTACQALMLPRQLPHANPPCFCLIKKKKRPPSEQAQSTGSQVFCVCLSFLYVWVTPDRFTEPSPEEWGRISVSVNIHNWVRFSLCYSPNGCFGEIIGKELNERLKNLENKFIHSFTSATKFY